MSWRTAVADETAGWAGAVATAADAQVDDVVRPERVAEQEAQRRQGSQRGELAGGPAG
jgi:hypothetical protein